MNTEPRPSQSFGMSWLRALITSVQFLTLLSWPGYVRGDAAACASDLRRGVIFFPLVGAGIGCFTAVCLWALAHVLPLPLALLTALAFEAALTGGFHEDAVADFCDAFGGGWTREDVLRILKDSRIGSFGALGLGFAVALRAAGLLVLDSVWPMAVTLVVSGAAGRLTAVAVMALVPPVSGREGLSNDAGQDANWKTFALSAALISPVLIFAWRHDAIALGAAVLALIAFIIWFRRTLMRRIGGATGDCLGFAAYIGIVIVSLAFARLH